LQDKSISKQYSVHAEPLGQGCTTSARGPDSAPEGVISSPRSRW